MGPLPGAGQTVPRAELTAATASAALSPQGEAALNLDAEYVTAGLKGTDQKKRSRAMSTNGDLWTNLFDVIGRRSANKVPAHTTAAQVAAGAVPIETYIGNGLADAAAGASAHLCQPSSCTRPGTTSNSSSPSSSPFAWLQ